MIFHAGVVALLVASVFVGGMMLLAAAHAAAVLRHWEPGSGSELQLSLERRTYLISTVVARALVFHLASLFLFIFTADDLCTLFAGAMCAAGTLHVNAFGYPALLLKLGNFLLASLWLVLNHLDARGEDYPLIRVKYLGLLGLAPLLVGESVLQAAYFVNLDPGVLTSCCGVLFDRAETTLAGELGALPPGPTQAAFFAVTGLSVGAGLFGWRTGRGMVALSVASAAAFVIGAAALVSFVSPYFYELPTHHCPFCLLQKEYGFVGYPLYLALLGGTVFGLSTGLLQPLRRVGTLAAAVPRYQRRFALWAALAFALLAAIPAVKMLATDFRL